MATSKTLTPTNVTIQIPEFTDQPDQRVNSNCIDKEADAINALNTNLTNLSNGMAFTKIYSEYVTNAQTKSLTLSDYAVVLVSITSYQGNNAGAGLWIVTGYASSATNGNVTQIINNTGDGSASVSISGNRLTIVVGRSCNIKVYAMN